MLLCSLELYRNRFDFQILLSAKEMDVQHSSHDVRVYRSKAFATCTNSCPGTDGDRIFQATPEKKTRLRSLEMWETSASLLEETPSLKAQTTATCSRLLCHV